MVKLKEVKGRLLESRPTSKIFEGFPYNLYTLLPPKLSEKEKRQAVLLIKVILRSASLHALLAEVGAKNAPIVEQFRNSVVQFIDINGLIRKLPDVKQLEIIHLSLLPITEKLGIEHKKDFIRYVILFIN